MKYPRQWEGVEHKSGADWWTATDRLRVPGGWLVRTMSRAGDTAETETLCFVPDLHGLWFLEDDEDTE